MLLIALVLATLICAVQAIRARPLLGAALWLAATSALTAAALFALGGQQVAVIELSVGAGMVTVLFVFAISLAGPGDALPPTVPKWLATTLIGSILILLIGLIWPVGGTAPVAASEASFAETFWNARQVDALLQIVILFAGGVSVIGFLVSHEIKPAAITTRAVSLTVPISPPLPESTLGPTAELVTEEVKT